MRASFVALAVCLLFVTSGCQSLSCAHAVNPLPDQPPLASAECDCTDEGCSGGAAASCGDYMAMKNGAAVQMMSRGGCGCGTGCCDGGACDGLCGAIGGVGTDGCGCGAVGCGAQRGVVRQRAKNSARASGILVRNGGNTRAAIRGDASHEARGAGGPCPRCGTKLGRGGLRGGCGACGLGRGSGVLGARIRGGLTGCGGNGVCSGSCGGAGLCGGKVKQAVAQIPAVHGFAAHTAQACANGLCGLPPGPTTGAVMYPYYTTRGPRDFLMANPPSIGP